MMVEAVLLRGLTEFYNTVGAQKVALFGSECLHMQLVNIKVKPSWIEEWTQRHRDLGSQFCDNTGRNRSDMATNQRMPGTTRAWKRQGNLLPKNLLRDLALLLALNYARCIFAVLGHPDYANLLQQPELAHTVYFCLHGILLQTSIPFSTQGHLPT